MDFGDFIFWFLLTLFACTVGYFIYNGLTDEYKTSDLCSLYGSVYPLNESEYGCELSNCTIMENDHTQLEKCLCEKNGNAVYRYCSQYIPVKEWTGDKQDLIEEIR